MPQFTIDLTEIEAATVIDLAAKRHDQAFTPSNQLELYLHRDLSKPVEDFQKQQAELVATVFSTRLDAQARIDFIAALSIEDPLASVDAFQAALDEYKKRIPSPDVGVNGQAIR